tara:strand:+ start:59 stop:289 length:231 start_codon:yes stop_codon:yes gene_type:complete
LQLGNLDNSRSGSMTDKHILIKDSGEMIDYWKFEVASQQQQLYKAYIRIKELNDEVLSLKKQITNTQLEFDFNANI